MLLRLILLLLLGVICILREYLERGWAYNVDTCVDCLRIRSVIIKPCELKPNIVKFC